MTIILRNPVNVLVYQHDAAHSFVEGRIASMNYDERTADVRSFLSSTIMEKVRFEDVVELGKLGNGIDWEQPRQEDVGKYIAIFWPDDGRWYSAKIDRVNSRTRYL